MTKQISRFNLGLRMNFRPSAISLITRLAESTPALILLGTLTLGWFVTPSDLPQETLCTFRRLFHFDCPGCGLTRAFLLLARGHLIDAITYNAAAPILYILFGIITITVIGRKYNPSFGDSRFWSQTRWFLAIMALAIMMIHWVIKVAIFFWML
ncbi:MAG: hypothetical protein ACD_62C00542G0003 [uncultured bacterium]|nr:MAG: hypothetical protein ACD_62C00542G0003 [uncultured bacterium]